MKNIRENILNILDDLVTNLDETLAFLEADQRTHVEDAVFFPKIEDIHYWIIPGFQKELAELLELAADPRP